MNLLSSPAKRGAAFRRRAIALGISGAVLAGAGVTGGIATAAHGAEPGAYDILLGVGSDSSQRIVNWYYPGATPVDQVLEIEKASETTPGAFNSSATSKTVIDASETVNGVGDTTASNAHAKVTGLQPSTSYTYHVGPKDGSNWSTPYSFTTEAGSGDFDFLFFGDPQIGSSGDAVADGAGWAKTLDYVGEHEPDAQLYVSGGDQVETANDEGQWSSFADSASGLKTHTWASTIGNHDVGGKSYEQHNQVPNVSQLGDYYPSRNTSTNSGGDYWYIYNDVLFIDLNSNAYTDGSDEAHVGFVARTIGQHGDEAKWTVLVYHHSIYSPADHANDSDNQQRRVDFTAAFSKLGVDLVLQGHDHSYSRSYAILNGTKANPDEQPGATEVFPGPGGVIYVTANSASGSKYYDLTTPDASKGGYGADPLDTSTGHKRHWANSVENQEHVRTYVKVAVSDDKLNVTTVRAGDCTPGQNPALDRNKVSTCGIDLKPKAENAGAPVGSHVDQFQLDKDAKATTVDLSSSASSLVAGSTVPVVLTANVGGGLGALAGTVSFYDNGSLLGSAPLSGTSASYTVSSAPSVGTHNYTAQFAPATVFVGAASTSAAAALSVTEPVKITPPADNNTPAPKSASATKVAYASGKVTVTVASAQSGVMANGTVTVYDGTTVLKTATVTNGTVSFAATLKPGTHKLRADFAETATVQASSSATTTVKIAKSKSTTKIAYAKGKVTVTVAPAVKGLAVSGKVKVYDGTKVLKTASVTKGKASFSVKLKKGTHKLHASFAATSTVLSSSSKTLTVKIAK